MGSEKCISKTTYNYKRPSLFMKKEDDLIIDNEIMGFDANVLVDLVNSQEFKEDLKAETTFGVLKIYTTELALSEARNVLIKKKDYSRDEATKELQYILSELNITKISHIGSANKIGKDWFNKIRNEMRIEKFSTFYNDCKILSALYN
tara:strand:- start:1998 stop:2441 length:444 start_codon:yes stop_codon:yes gene_type:complete